MNNKTISAAPCLEGLSLQWHRMTKFQKKVLTLLFLGGCLCMTAAFLTKKHRSPIEWDGTVFEIDRVNPLDAALAHAYNSTIDNIADGFVFVVNALVVVGLCLRVFQKGGKAEAFAQFFYDGYTFILSWMYTSSFFRLLKTFAGRIRPYMYFPNPSEKGVLEAERSFCVCHACGRLPAVLGAGTENRYKVPEAAGGRSPAAGAGNNDSARSERQSFPDGRYFRRSARLCLRFRRFPDLQPHRGQGLCIKGSYKALSCGPLFSSARRFVSA